MPPRYELLPKVVELQRVELLQQPVKVLLGVRYSGGAACQRGEEDSRHGQGVEIDPQQAHYARLHLGAPDIQWQLSQHSSQHPDHRGGGADGARRARRERPGDPAAAAPRPQQPAPAQLSSGSPFSNHPSIQTTEEMEKMEPDEPAESALVTQRQLGLERPCPNRPPLPWLSSGRPPHIPPSLQTAKEVAGRALDSLRQGLHTVSSKDFETFATLNLARILRSTAELLESTEEEAREQAKGRTPPRTAGSGSPTTYSPPPCPTSTRINSTDVQELREEKPRTANNKDKANVTDVARILRCAPSCSRASRQPARNAETPRSLKPHAHFPRKMWT